MIERIAELIRYRGLLRSLIVRNLKLRYKSSMLGFAWSLLSPLLMMGAFAFVFTVLMPSGQVDKYPLFVLCGLLPWQFFSSSLSYSVGAVIHNAHLVKKIYFPREILPLASVLSNLVDFLVASFILLVLVILLGHELDVWLAVLPLVILMETLFALGLSFGLSALNVLYRDVQQLMSFVLLMWFFFTPVFYSLENSMPIYTVKGLQISIRDWIYRINPLAIYVDAYRAVLYGQPMPASALVLQTILVTLSLLAMGYGVFLRLSPRFPEEV
jgi:ABC-type polysaccharide/polyol phosphate export permease